MGQALHVYGTKFKAGGRLIFSFTSKYNVVGLSPRFKIREARIQNFPVPLTGKSLYLSEPQ